MMKDEGRELSGPEHDAEHDAYKERVTEAAQALIKAMTEAPCDTMLEEGIYNILTLAVGMVAGLEDGKRLVAQARKRGNPSDRANCHLSDDDEDSEGEAHKVEIHEPEWFKGLGGLAS